MTKEVAGIDLRTLEMPIHDALEMFQEISNQRIVFDLDNAPTLELTPDKPNSARSTTEVSHRGETIGKMSVIAFAPYDGTGDESAYSVHDVTSAPRYVLPISPKIVPRSKTGIYSEIHLPLTGQFTALPDRDPVLFAGHLDVLGFDNRYRLITIGRLGQGLTDFVNALESGSPATPTARLTTGYDRRGERFGDPHSVYNGSPVALQVCAFLAIRSEMADEHKSIVDELKAVPA